GANTDLARATMGRYEAADAEGAVAKQAVDQSVATFRTAQAAVAAAEANVLSYKANVQRMLELTSFQRVVAPFTGTVIQRNVDVGALITAGSPVNNTAVAPSTVTGAANGLFEIAQIGPAGTHWRIPATALIFNAQGTRVVLVGAGNKLHFQQVVVGRDLGTAIDVQSGLEGHETVVKQPTVSLQEGQTVNPVASPATA